MLLQTLGIPGIHHMATSEQAIPCFAVLFLYHVWLLCDVQSVFMLVYKQLEDFALYIRNPVIYAEYFSTVMSERFTLKLMP